MADFDQFANQGGAAAGDPAEAEAALKASQELLEEAAPAASAANFGAGPLETPESEDELDVEEDY
ncbi:MAG: hypothetical protein JWN36_1001 [Microbacteriaceae bacterium]|nr:hypothetical protein [Microbacteriaceae bacterium]